MLPLWGLLHTPPTQRSCVFGRKRFRQNTRCRLLRFNNARLGLIENDSSKCGVARVCGPGPYYRAISMNEKEFINLIKQFVPVGDVLVNPKNGTKTKIIGYTNRGLKYTKGENKSTFFLGFYDMYKAWMNFRGWIVRRRLLVEHNPRVFGNHHKAQSCHCVVLFKILGKIGLAGPIQGEGGQTDPFRAEFYQNLRCGH